MTEPATISLDIPHDPAERERIRSMSMSIPQQSETTALLHMIERVSRDPGANLDNVRQLLNMRREIVADERRMAFNAAIGAAKSDMPEIKKNKRVSFGNGKTAYEYEDLAEIERTVTPKLSEHGLSYRFRTDSVSTPGMVIVTCIVSHKDGHAEENSLSAAADTSGSKNAIQALGSSVTYLERYTLKAALGLAASTDDDGITAGAREVISEEQAKQISDLIVETKSNVDLFLKYVGVPSVADIPAKDFTRIVALLEKKRMKP